MTVILLFSLAAFLFSGCAGGNNDSDGPFTVRFHQLGRDGIYVEIEDSAITGIEKGTVGAITEIPSVEGVSLQSNSVNINYTAMNDYIPNGKWNTRFNGKGAVYSADDLSGLSVESDMNFYAQYVEKMPEEDPSVNGPILGYWLQNCDFLNDPNEERWKKISTIEFRLGKPLAEEAYPHKWNAGLGNDLESIRGYCRENSNGGYDVVLAAVSVGANCIRLSMNFRITLPTSIAAIDLNDIPGVIESSLVFEGSQLFFRGIGDYLENLETIEGMNLLNTTQMNAMFMMFAGCKKLKLGNTDLSSFDTSNVKVMAKMFENCESLEELDLSSFNVKSVESLVPFALPMLDMVKSMDNASEMFAGCKSLKTIKVSDGDVDWTASNLKFKGLDMFKGCVSLKGGNGTECNGSDNISGSYAHVDSAGKPGYFTSV